MREGNFSYRIPPRRTKYQNEIDVIASDLNDMAQELGSVEALQSGFVADASHEMKTPLAIISNYTTIMQDPGLSEDERIEYACKCGEAARKLSNMVSDIMRLNKLEHQPFGQDATSIDLSEQLAQCLIGVSDVFDSKGIALDVDMQEGIRVEGDPELFLVVWNNLLSNACKFTDQGGRVTVSLSRQEDADEGRTWARVQVSDTGCGIASDKIPRVFDKFYQGDESRSKEGNGLGLALTKRIVDLYNGKVGVRSELGVGTTFTVELPLCANA